MELDDRPSPAKFAVAENAIGQAKFVTDRIDKRRPNGN